MVITKLGGDEMEGVVLLNVGDAKLFLQCLFLVEGIYIMLSTQPLLDPTTVHQHRSTRVKLDPKQTSQLIIKCQNPRGVRVC